MVHRRLRLHGDSSWRLSGLSLGHRPAIIDPGAQAARRPVGGGPGGVPGAGRPPHPAPVEHRGARARERRSAPLRRARPADHNRGNRFHARATPGVHWVRHSRRRGGRAGSPGLRIDRIRVVPRLRSFFSGTIRIEEVSLDGFTVSVSATRTAGTRPAVFPAPSKDSSAAVAIERVRVAGGRRSSSTRPREACARRRASRTSARNAD